MDFVNQSVLQISSQDVEGKRSDKTDFAEQLGAMNRRWQILQGLVTEKVRHTFLLVCNFCWNMHHQVLNKFFNSTFHSNCYDDIFCTEKIIQMPKTIVFTSGL